MQSPQQALNPSFQAALNLCAVQHIFPGHSDPRGRAGQTGACPHPGWLGFRICRLELFNLGSFGQPRPLCSWWPFCLPVPHELDPLQLVKFRVSISPPPAGMGQHLRALCHQQVSATGPGFPSCDRIRKGLEFFPETLYGQPQSPEQATAPTASSGRNENEQGKVEGNQAVSHTVQDRTLAWPSSITCRICTSGRTLEPLLTHL